jgi:hypothetical protein
LRRGASDTIRLLVIPFCSRCSGESFSAKQSIIARDASAEKIQKQAALAKAQAELEQVIAKIGETAQGLTDADKGREDTVSGGRLRFFIILQGEKNIASEQRTSTVMIT